MRFVIGAVALLVLGSIFGALAGLLFWPDISYATISVRGMRLDHQMFMVRKPQEKFHGIPPAFQSQGFHQ